MDDPYAAFDERLRRAGRAAVDGFRAEVGRIRAEESARVRAEIVESDPDRLARLLDARDSVALWLARDAALRVDSAARVWAHPTPPRARLYQRYLLWMGDDPALTAHRFYDRLRQLGFAEHRGKYTENTRGLWVFAGIHLVEDDDE